MTQIEQTTRLLRKAAGGASSAADELLPLVYDELRTLAGGYMRRERSDHTLQPTALVHEAFIRMVNQSDVAWENRAHFFAVAAQMIRRVLVDHARSHAADRRGGKAARVELHDPAADDGVEEIDLLALHEALKELERRNDRHRKVVELRYFGGMTLEEVAHVLDLSRETVKADWRTARAWLRVRLDEES